MICIIPCPKCGETLRVPEQVAAHPEEIECHMNAAPNPSAGAGLPAVVADLLDALRFIAASNERDEDAEDTPEYLRDIARRAIARATGSAR